MFRNLWRKIKGEGEAGQLDQDIQTESDIDQLPELPPRVKKEDIFSIPVDNYGGKFEKQIDKAAATIPILEKVYHLPDFQAKLDAVRGMTPANRKRLIPHLSVFIYHLQKIGRLDDAQELARLQIEVIRLYPEDESRFVFENSMPRIMADALVQLGEIYENQSELSLALQTYLEADEWHEKDQRLRLEHHIQEESEFDRLFNPRDVRANLYAKISHICGELGQHQAAVEYNNKAWGAASIKSNPESRLENLFGRGYDYRLAGDIDKALETFKKALELAIEISETTVVTRDLSRACVAMGDVYMDLDLPRRALEYYQKSYEFNKASNHYERMITDCTSIAVLHTEKGDVTEAIRYYRKALGYCSIQVPEPGLSSASPLTWTWNGTTYRIVRGTQAWKILHQLGNLERSRDSSKAEDHLQLAIELIEGLRGRVVLETHRIGLQSSVIGVYELMIELQLERYRKEKSDRTLEALFSYIERAKSRVLLEQLADLPLSRPESLPVDLFERETELFRKSEAIEAQIATGAGDLTRLDEDLDAARKALEDVWDEIARVDPYAGAEYVSLRRAAPVTINDIRGLINQTASTIAVVEYYLSETSLVIIVIRSDRQEVICKTEDISRDQVRELVLVNPDSPPALDLRLPYWQLDLAPLLLEPIRERIQGCDFLCFIPHDVLHSLPIHALHMDPAEKSCPAEIAGVFYLPSASLLKYSRKKQRRRQGNNLVIGNPSRPDQTPIQHTQVEAQRIASILDCEPLLELDATRDIFIEKAPLAEYIHVACHGKFDRGDALSSALLMTDGDLTVRDLFEMQLGAKLVALSACETGINENRSGDELIGFVRALLYAGAPTVVLSLWNAYDEATSELMVNFYEKVEKDRLPKAKALSQAQSELEKKGLLTSIWAPFILVGDWD